MMKAVQYTANSTDFKDAHIVEVEKPKPSPGLAVVRVVAAAGNPIDYKVMQGSLIEAGWSMPFPFTMGYDFSGVVDGVAEEDKGVFAIGDEVFAVNWGQHRHDEGDLPVGGAFAEYIRVPVSRLSKKPAGISFAQAAAVALVGTTAYQAVVDCANVSAGSKVLILGGASAVGQIAIQLAKSRGAWVAATCSERTMKFVSQFGADKLVNYRESKWEDDIELKNMYAVIDTVGETKGFKRATTNEVVKKGGRFVSIASADVGSDPAAHWPRLSFGAFTCLSNCPAVQDKLAEMVVDGSLKIPIMKVFPFTKKGVHEMLAQIESGTSTGKNVLEISSA
jgi:NADPH:quinone reductase-like Zn-dependent oxidoreductase